MAQYFHLRYQKKPNNLIVRLLICDPTGIRTQIKGTGILHSIHLTMGPFLKAVTKVVFFLEQ